MCRVRIRTLPELTLIAIVENLPVRNMYLTWFLGLSGT